MRQNIKAICVKFPFDLSSDVVTTFFFYTYCPEALTLNLHYNLTRCWVGPNDNKRLKDQSFVSLHSVMTGVINHQI